MAATLLWFRQDLRLSDQPALDAAIERGSPIVPVFVWDPQTPWTLGGASRWWLHHSLKALDTSLRERGSRLVLRQGHSADVLETLIRETSADAVFWSRRYEPAAVQEEAHVKALLEKQGVNVQDFNAGLLYEPWELQTQTGKPYQVFTPFWKSCLAKPPPPAPTNAPRSMLSLRRWPASEDLNEWNWLPRIPWDKDFKNEWTPGEAGAQHALAHFLDQAVAHYPDDRDRPARLGTSRLSPHLHFGEISPRHVWHAAHRRMASDQKSGLLRGAEAHLRQLVWREFAYHLIYHFPQTADRPLRPAFERFPWKPHAGHRRAWQRGQTGYPLVDAGMRQLWSIGWMHNRVRLIVGSFLVKNLLMSWQDGAAWFWDTLVDADLANNILGWQWVSGCGADAAPYFRIFNPVAQGERFDPDGDYVRQWVPELASLPSEWIHKPFDAPKEVLRAAGVTLGKTYPAPIVDLQETRAAALAALATLKGHLQTMKKPVKVRKERRLIRASDQP